MNIILAGSKGVGKSTIGRILGEWLETVPLETDQLAEQVCLNTTGRRLTCRRICETYGEEAFRAMEAQAVLQAANARSRLIATGGQSLMNPDAPQALLHTGIE